MADLEKQLLFNSGVDWVIADVDGYEGEESLCLEYRWQDAYRLGVSPLIEVEMPATSYFNLRLARETAIDSGNDAAVVTLKMRMPVDELSALIGTLEGLEQYAGAPVWLHAQLLLFVPLMDQ